MVYHIKLSNWHQQTTCVVWDKIRKIALKTKKRNNKTSSLASPARRAHPKAEVYECLTVS